MYSVPFLAKVPLNLLLWWSKLRIWCGLEVSFAIFACPPKHYFPRSAILMRFFGKSPQITSTCNLLEPVKNRVIINVNIFYEKKNFPAIPAFTFFRKKLKWQPWKHTNAITEMTAMEAYQCYHWNVFGVSFQMKGQKGGKMLSVHYSVYLAEVSCDCQWVPD